jgi:hypothetical protein
MRGRRHVMTTTLIDFHPVSDASTLNSVAIPSIVEQRHSVATKMSRAPAPAAPRNLTLTEELEKLEQSITLTLQGKI